MFYNRRKATLFALVMALLLGGAFVALEGYAISKADEEPEAVAEAVDR